MARRIEAYMLDSTQTQKGLLLGSSWMRLIWQKIFPSHQNSDHTPHPLGVTKHSHFPFYVDWHNTDHQGPHHFWSIWAIHCSISLALALYSQSQWEISTPHPWPSTTQHSYNPWLFHPTICQASCRIIHKICGILHARLGCQIWSATTCWGVSGLYHLQQSSRASSSHHHSNGLY